MASVQGRRRTRGYAFDESLVFVLRDKIASAMEFCRSPRSSDTTHAMH